MWRFKTRIVFVLLLCSTLLVSMLFYLMFTFDDSHKFEKRHYHISKPMVIVGFNEVRTTNETLLDSYRKRLKRKEQSWLHKPLKVATRPELMSYIHSLKKDLLLGNLVGIDYRNIWPIAKSWIRARQIIPAEVPQLGLVLNALQKAKILKSDVIRKGTQLKLLLSLEGGQYALFKPKRYSREFVADGIVAGSDRHNGEIVAFHLSRILNMRYAPLVTSRTLNVPVEIRPTATVALANTFITQLANDNRTKLDCFYGECYYCNEYDPVCPELNGLLEGAMILFLPVHYKLQKIRNPWQRTYKERVKAKWENDRHYCLAILKSTEHQRVLDYVDLSIFDYLIGNADRHHFEVFKDVPNSMLLLIDNGKSFGDPNHDELTILYPLLQCCMIRNATYHQLHRLASYKLSTVLTELLSEDQLWPLLTPAHLQALDRRLTSVIAAAELCLDSFNKNDVLKT